MARDVIAPGVVVAAVERAMDRPWSWGTADCCAAACDVFAGLWGVDPLVPIRGGYCDRRTAVRLVRDGGGFVAMAERLAHVAGLVTGCGVPGAIGLSAAGVAEGPERRALLVCIGPGAWAVKTRSGWAVLPAAERCWQWAG